MLFWYICFLRVQKSKHIPVSFVCFAKFSHNLIRRIFPDLHIHTTNKMLVNAECSFTFSGRLHLSAIRKKCPETFNNANIHVGFNRRNNAGRAHFIAKEAGKVKRWNQTEKKEKYGLQRDRMACRKHRLGVKRVKG